MTLFVGLGGYAQSGKDSTAQFLVQDHGFVRIGFADALRKISEVLDPGLEVGPGTLAPLNRILTLSGGWDGAKVQYPSVRSWLQRLGTEAGRQVLGESIWVDTVFRQVERDGLERVVIPDVRFWNEIGAVEKHGGITAWVRRPGVKPVNAHASDNTLGENDFAAVIDNDSTLEALRQKVQYLAEDFGFA